MKVLIDTNVIIDNLASRTPYDGDAKAIFNHIATNRITGYVNISSITDIYYIIRKTFMDTDFRKRYDAIKSKENVYAKQRNNETVASTPVPRAPLIQY